MEVSYWYTGTHMGTHIGAFGMSKSTDQDGTNCGISSRATIVNLMYTINFIQLFEYC